MSTINDLLRRVPMLAVLPLIVWLFGMTAWTASWKAETDYKLSLVMKTSTAIEEQSDRVIAIGLVPLGTTAYYFNLAAGGLTLSSELQTVALPSPTP